MGYEPTAFLLPKYIWLYYSPINAFYSKWDHELQFIVVIPQLKVIMMPQYFGEKLKNLGQAHNL